MDIKQYEIAGRTTYERLAGVTRSILLAAIKSKPDLRVQHIQHRAKSLASLRRKLKRQRKLSSPNIEMFAKDLAGCRVIFYTNSDVSAFLKSQIIYDNFEIDWDRTKIHHPSPDSEDATQQFISNNYVVKIKSDRAALPEYDDVAELWCEIQVQTALNHAWAEMAHDTIYKRPELPKGCGAGVLKSIEDRMLKIQKEYLLPAGYEFQKVQADYERLLKGKDLFDEETLSKIILTDDNNERFEMLERFCDFALPLHDDIQSVYPNLLPQLVSAIEKARSCETREISTPFGSYPGHSSDDFADKAADVIDSLRNADLPATFDALLMLYERARSDKEKARWVTSSEQMAEHNLHAWKQIGPAIQAMLVDQIDKISPSTMIEVRGLVVGVLAKVVGAEISGTTSNYASITLHRGSVPYSKSLVNIRAKALGQLEGIFLSARNDADRRSAWQAMHQATRASSAPGFSEKMDTVIIRDSRKVVDFFRSHVGFIGFELLQHIEHEFLWLYRHNQKKGQSEHGPTAIEKARSALDAAIVKFRDKANRDRSFVIYKTLVGFQSVFEPAWTDDEFDIQGEADYREQKITELVASVNNGNKKSWYNLLLRCAQTESNDLATFPSFGSFLQKLGKAKPKILLSYLKFENPIFIRFLTSILLGLDDTDSHANVENLICGWVADGKYLSEISWSQRAVLSSNALFANTVLDAAIAAGDEISALNIIEAANRRKAHWPDGEATNLALRAISFLAQRGNTAWASGYLGARASDSVFASLHSDQAKGVLAALVAHPRIDWREEEILSAIAVDHLNQVISFFAERLSYPAKKGTGYSAIPFQLHKLPEILSVNALLIASSAFEWFIKDKQSFEYRGGALVANIFPELGDTIENVLEPYAKSQDPEQRLFVTKILRSYDGQFFLHRLAKIVIASSDPSDTKILKELHMVLDETGVVTGEFGHVEAYRAKKTELENWLIDPSKKIAAFAQQHILSLDKQIAAEQRRAEEDVEMRKREWGNADADE